MVVVNKVDYGKGHMDPWEAQESEEESAHGEEQHILTLNLQLQDTWVCARRENWPPSLLCWPQAPLLWELLPPECGLLEQHNKRSGGSVVSPLCGAACGYKPSLRAWAEAWHSSRIHRTCK